MDHFNFDVDSFQLEVNTDSLECTKCLTDFVYFLKYVKTITESGEVLELPDWPYIRRLALAIVNNDRLVILKARQILCSWIIVAYCVWQCLQNDNLIILVISQGKNEAKEIIRRAYDIYHRLPEFITKSHKLKDGPPNKENIEWANTSRLIALPSKADASRSVSPKIVFIDEAAYCRELPLMLAAIEPQLRAGSKLFIVSTPNGQMKGREFTRVCKEHKSMGYKRLGIHYRLCPVYQDPAWEKQKRAAMTPQKFAHEYELSLATAGEGVILTTFSGDNIDEEPFYPDENYILLRAIDPGPKCCMLWAAEDRLGNIDVYREVYFHGGSYQERAKRMIRLGGENEFYESTEIDSADPQARTDLMKHGIICRPCLTKDMYETIDILKLMFSGDGLNVPRLTISPDCPKLISQIREWIGDDNGYPVKHQYDHGVDALRYLVHRRWRLRQNRQNGFDTKQVEEQNEIEKEFELGLEIGGDKMERSYDDDDRDFSESEFGLGTSGRF